MKEKVGQIFSIAQDNPPVAGCTISKTIYSSENYISYFSLARNTDISAEIYPYHKLILVHQGALTLYGNGQEKQINTGDCLVTKTNVPQGLKTSQSTVYTELSFKEEKEMNEVIKPGEVFTLKDLVPYQEGKIVNMDIVHNDKMKFVVMAFDAGTGLSPHAAPGEAIIFALDGEAVIGYEGKEYPLKAGQQFHFAKGGMHAVTANEKFKMALLLTLD